MKPYGREKKITAKWKKDVHPKKGWVNWWETICGCLSRTTMKHNWRKENNL